VEEFTESITKAVEVYNRYRRPEAEVTVVSVEEKRLTARFRGPYCITCGVYDWFEDLGYELKTLNPTIEFKITRIEQTGEQEFTVEFELERR